MAALIKHWPERRLNIRMEQQPLNDRLHDLIWDLEAVAVIAFGRPPFEASKEKQA